MMKKIAVVTGSRAEYDILYSSMCAIKRHKDLELQVIVTGPHLSREFGNTYKEIERDGFRIGRKVRSFFSNKRLVDRAISVGVQITGLARAFEELKPDIILVAGDREEVICSALAASYLNMPVAHMCGGDIAYGSVDNTVRDATTKLAHIHLAMLPEHARRIIKMGEQKDRVYVVGHGGLDRLLTTEHLSKKALSEQLKFDINKGPVVLMIQHVLSSEHDEAGSQIAATLSALADLKYKVLIGYPNSDVGSKVIVKTISQYKDKLDCCIYKNLTRTLFVNLLRHADLLIGNSSCGIIEAPIFKLPVVNIGNRQLNRIRSNNVIFVEHNKVAIKRVIKKALFDKTFVNKVKGCKSIYGDGHTGERVADILNKVALNSALLNKPNL